MVGRGLSVDSDCVTIAVAYGEMRCTVLVNPCVLCGFLVMWPMLKICTIKLFFLQICLQT